MQHLRGRTVKREVMPHNELCTKQLEKIQMQLTLEV